MTSPSLSYGLGFPDLYDREGLVRLDAAFADWLKEAHVEAHARLMAARVAPDAMAAKDESNLLIELARPLEIFSRPCSMFPSRPPSCAAGTPAGADLRLQAAVRAALCDARHQAGSDCGARRRCRHRRDRLAGAPRGRAGGVGARLRASRAGARWSRVQGGDAHPRDRRSGALRCLGVACAGRQEAPSRRAVVQGAAQARLRASGADRDRDGGWRHAHDVAAVAAAPSRRLRADRRRFRPGARARSRQLLHLVPQPGQGTAARAD